MYSIEKRLQMIYTCNRINYKYRKYPKLIGLEFYEVEMATTTVRQLLEVKGNDIWSIYPNSTVYDALRMMADKDVGALLVMEDDHLVGIISERDYARKVILKGKASMDTRVREIMTNVLFTVHPDQTIHECMELMTNKHVRHLPVVLDNKVIGIISIGDVVKNIIFMQRETIKDLERHITS
jgi:CBS domain-containing protein